MALHMLSPWFTRSRIFYFPKFVFASSSFPFLIFLLFSHTMKISAFGISFVHSGRKNECLHVCIVSTERGKMSSDFAASVSGPFSNNSRKWIGSSFKENTHTHTHTKYYWCAAEIDSDDARPVSRMNCSLNNWFYFVCWTKRKGKENKTSSRPFSYGRATIRLWSFAQNRNFS